jgi:Flp pilus assembly protein TadG
MLTRSARALGRDQRGVAAVEFALLAPLMVMIYFGVAELTDGLMTSRRISHVASAIGDLTAQSASTTPAQVGDIFNVGRQLMQPSVTSSTTFKLRLSSVTVDANNVPRVDWSQATSGYSALAKGAAVSLPLAAKTAPTDPDTPFVAKGQSVVMAEAHYTFASPVAQYMPQTSDLNDTLYLMPRSGSAILCPTC